MPPSWVQARGCELQGEECAGERKARLLYVRTRKDSVARCRGGRCASGWVTPSEVAREGDYRHLPTQRRKGDRGLGGSFVDAFDMEAPGMGLCAGVAYPPMVYEEGGKGKGDCGLVRAGQRQVA